MESVKEGDKVKIKYEAKLENGEECFPENKDNTIESEQPLPRIELALRAI